MSRVSLEEFLAPISQRLYRTTPPESMTPCDYAQSLPSRVTDGLGQDELVGMFCDEAQKIRVDARRCAAADAAAAVTAIIEEGASLGVGAGGAGSGTGSAGVVLADDPVLADLGITQAVFGCEAASPATVWDASAGREAYIDACDKALFGITHAMAGIAESGTVVQVNNERCGRSISLLPLVHIAVVRAQDIAPTMREALLGLQESDKPLPSQICMISGPSVTSDIELVRVEGVHGPMYVHYVVVE